MTEMTAAAHRTDTPRKRAPRALTVVRHPDPAELGAQIDWSSWYLTDEEDMGEGGEQCHIIWVLRQSIQQLADERGWSDVNISSDQFFAWMPEEPLVRVSPDVYVQTIAPPTPAPGMWETWRPEHPPPAFAVEVVSAHPSRPSDWRKDYDHNPAKYAQLGARELVIFDPDALTGRAREAQRVPLQAYRREPDGSFVRYHHGPGPLRSDVLDIWIVAQRLGDAGRMRLARDAEGRTLVPTLAEARDEERRARAAADAMVAKLEAELAKLRGG